VLCVARVTNQMVRIQGDFEDGNGDDARDSLDLTAAVARACGSAATADLPNSQFSGIAVPNAQPLVQASEVWEENC